MDSFDLERLQAYRRKIFEEQRLSEDQAADYEDLRRRQAEENARKVLKEEREELRRQAEEDRQAQRELFQQQRELLILSRRGSGALEHSPVQSYKHLPRVVPASSHPLPSLDTTASSSASTALNSSVNSLKLSPIQDSIHVPRIPSVGDLYASPNRTPTAAARAQTLALQQAQREQAAAAAQSEANFYNKKREQRRAATLQRNLAAHFEGQDEGSSRGVKFKRMRAPSPDREPEIKSCVTELTEGSDSCSTEGSLPDLSTHESVQRKSLDFNMTLNHQHHLHQLPVRPYNHTAYYDHTANYDNTTTTTSNNNNNNGRSGYYQQHNQRRHHSHGDMIEKVPAPIATLTARGPREAGVNAVFIETFDVMLRDIRGPLGQRCGGLRQYFRRLLENFVTTGCIYRTANKIGICVHGTVEVLDMVRRVLEHAAKNPMTPKQGSSAAGKREPISWKFHSTGRSVRYGSWGKHFATRLCENAQAGKFSPRGMHEQSAG